MTKEFIIGGVPMRFTGNSATTYRYKQVFHNDILKIFMEQGQSMETERILELAYIMHLQAEGYTNEQYNAETFDDYVAWLEQFSFSEFLTSAPDILSVWVDTSKQGSVAKKKSAQQKDR